MPLDDFRDYEDDRLEFFPEPSRFERAAPAIVAAAVVLLVLFGASLFGGR